MEIKCIGCGAIIQTDFAMKPGFIDAEVLEKKQNDFYCQRCFNLRHYNRNHYFKIDDQDYKKNLEILKKKKGLFVLVVDIFDFEGTMIYNINDLFPKNEILLVLNKCDLFIKTIKPTKIIEYIKKILKEQKVKIIDLLLISTHKNQDIEMLIEKINLYRKNEDVYFVGMTNVGKSTILNKIIYRFSNEIDIITVSNNINTTLANIYIPLNEKNYLIDTPGLINQKNLIYYLEKETLKKITARNYIRPKTFQLNPGQTIFIQGFLRIDFLSGERSSLTTYFENNLLIHRTKLINADEFYNNHQDDILKYPTVQERVKLGHLKTISHKFISEVKEEIVISGLGFASISGNCFVKIHYFENNAIKIRKAMI